MTGAHQDFRHRGEGTVLSATLLSWSRADRLLVFANAAIGIVLGLNDRGVG